MESLIRVQFYLQSENEQSNWSCVGGPETVHSPRYELRLEILLSHTTLRTKVDTVVYRGTLVSVLKP